MLNVSKREKKDYLKQGRKIEEETRTREHLLSGKGKAITWMKKVQKRR